MSQQKAISGFSKMSANEKIKWLVESHNLPAEYIETIESHLHTDPGVQSAYNDFSENTISNFFLPFGIAPNFLINGNWYAVPMVIEESSVVAAASHAAKFWSSHGGFHAAILGKTKVGQVHFMWTGTNTVLREIFAKKKDALLESLDALTESMRKRGGGIIDVLLEDKSLLLNNYFQLYVEFLTADAMGANFINTVLEATSKEWSQILANEISSKSLDADFEINMAILSNYTPESLVSVSLETEVSELNLFSSELSGLEFAEKFVRACEIAQADVNRAVTHNKGIFNGMDAVVIASGNDFRAVEACGHAYAARDGQYRGLSKAELTGDRFRFELIVPMSVGTVGGLTGGHPLARASLKILQDPSAEQLMMIVAAAGLANNFSAIRSLISSGIQKGHMKMHLTNILRQLNADESQKLAALEFFKEKTISYGAVKKFLIDTK
jgi:hydroxymethylglutaryl-CoA reductase